MRKVTASLLAILIVLTFCLPVMAAGSTQLDLKMISSATAMTSGNNEQPIISEEKARESLNSMFPEITGKDLKAEYNEQSFMGKACWEFQSNNIMHPSIMRGLEIDALVDASTGEVIQMSYNPGPDLYRGKSVNLTREQAQQIAQTFLGQVQPDKVSLLTISNTELPYYYNSNGINMFYMFLWNRMANGITVDSDNIYIGVDAVTGMVSHYTCNWHDCDFPQVDKTMSKQELTAKVLGESGLCPAYVSAVGAYSNAANTFIPAYILNSPAVYYDCHTGQGLNFDGSKISANDMRSYEQAFIPQQDGSGNNAYLATGKKVSPEIARKAAEDFFQYMGLSGDIQRSGGGSSGGPGLNQEFWTFSISSGSRYQDMEYAQVGVNVYTGKITQFNQHNSPIEVSGKNISIEEAVIKATELIGKINPEKKNLVILQKQDWAGNDDGTNSFHFARLINGIPSEQEGISVAINKATGQLMSYWVNWYDIQHAPLSNIISPEKAQTIYQVQEPFELTYVFPVQNPSAPGQDRLVPPMLVYRNVEKSRIDAVSGEMRGWRIGNQSPAVTASFNGHWAAPALSLLNENGLIPAEGVNPDGQMTRRQVLKVLVRAIGSPYYSDDQTIDLAFTDINSNDPDAQVLQQAITEAVLPNQGQFNPDIIMSREDLAVWLVNSLGYQDVATMKNRIDIPYKDADQIAPDKTNYVGLVQGLGLLGVDENRCFNPQAAITWAEMASVATQLATRAHAGY